MTKIKITLLLIVLAACWQLSAQQAQEILGIAKESKNAAYYEEQAKLWKIKTRSNTKDANAWLNYYKAQRAYYQSSDYNQWLNDRKSIHDKLTSIVNEIGQHLPNSFEYYYIKSFNSVDEDESYKYQLKAYNIDPEREETYEGLFTRYMVDWDTEKAKEIALRIVNSNLYANSVYMWNNNILQSADKNSIIITSGDMDTNPRWVLQVAHSIRQDVMVMNQWLMVYSETYRNGIFSKLRIQPFPNPEASFNSKETYKNQLLKYIIEQCSANRSIHFDCGTDIKLFTTLGIKDKMYLTGISFTYSDDPIDNLSITKRNFEQLMSLEYLTTSYQIHSQDEVVKRFMNLTYIPGLMKLKKHYEILGNAAKSRENEDLINHIANESGRKKEVLSWYGKQSF